MMDNVLRNKIQKRPVTDHKVQSSIESPVEDCRRLSKADDLAAHLMKV
jgi:hypothetical protein